MEPSLDLDIRKDTLADGITQSELSTYDECHFKWNLRYNNRLQVDRFDWNFWVGGAWHEFQKKWRTDPNCDVTKFVDPVEHPLPKDGRDENFEKWLVYWREVLPVFQQAYAVLYEGENRIKWDLVETELQTEYLGFLCRGVIDLAHNKNKIIRDFKSTVSAWLISPDGWNYKLQFMFYCWLMRQNGYSLTKKAFNFQMDIMQKPALKQTNADMTWQGHIRRVKGDIISRPQFYLRRETAQILPENIQHFEDFVLTPKLQQLALARDNPVEAQCIITNPNTNACNLYGNRCEFTDICQKGWESSKYFFVQRQVKHVEIV